MDAAGQRTGTHAGDVVPNLAQRKNAAYAQRLPSSEKAVLVCLAVHCGMDWWWTSGAGARAKLAELTGLSDKTVGRAIDSLRRGGLIKTRRDERRDHGALTGTYGPLHIKVMFDVMHPDYVPGKRRGGAPADAVTYTELAARLKAQRQTVDPS